MLKRWLALVAGIAALSALASADDSYRLGNAAFSAPPGWKQIDGTDERSTFASPDGCQQVTISILRLTKAPSFDDFEQLCAQRYDAEKNGVKDLVLIPKDPAPRHKDGKFFMVFSGEENPRGRVFSGFLWIKGTNLVTVYVEGIGVSADRNSDSFHEILRTLR